MRALKSVDLPMLGRPMIAIVKKDIKIAQRLKDDYSRNGWREIELKLLIKSFF